MSNISQMNVTFAARYVDDSYADISTFKPIGSVIHGGDNERHENAHKWDVTQVGIELRNRRTD